MPRVSGAIFKRGGGSRTSQYKGMSSDQRKSWTVAVGEVKHTVPKKSANPDWIMIKGKDSDYYKMSSGMVKGGLRFIGRGCTITGDWKLDDKRKHEHPWWKPAFILQSNSHFEIPNGRAFRACCKLAWGSLGAECNWDQVSKQHWGGIKKEYWNGTWSKFVSRVDPLPTRQDAKGSLIDAINAVGQLRVWGTESTREHSRIVHVLSTGLQIEMADVYSVLEHVWGRPIHDGKLPLEHSVPDDVKRIDENNALGVVQRYAQRHGPPHVWHRYNCEHLRVVTCEKLRERLVGSVGAREWSQGSARRCVVEEAKELSGNEHDYALLYEADEGVARVVSKMSEAGDMPLLYLDGFEFRVHWDETERSLFVYSDRALRHAAGVARYLRDYVPRAMRRPLHDEPHIPGVSPDQRSAVRGCLRSPFAVVDSLAGRGKSWTLLALRAALLRTGLNVLLLAPQHKQVARLREMADGAVKAMTVDSLIFRLRRMKLEGGTHDDLLDLEGMTAHEGVTSEPPAYEGDGRCGGVALIRCFMRHTSILVDEATALSGRHMAKLVEHAPAGLYLFGDRNQLPAPANLGQPMMDIVHLPLPLSIFQLPECFRSSNTIVPQADRVVQGLAPEETAHVHHTPVASEDDMARAVVDSLIRHGPANHQVIVWENKLRGHLFGAYCERIGRPKLPEKHKLRFFLNRYWSERAVLPGDRIIMDRGRGPRGEGVYNKMCGVVKEVVCADGSPPKILLDVFDAGPIPRQVSLGTQDDLACMCPAYFITCHSSQGSEYDHVVVVLPRWYEGLPRRLQRNWLYVAASRARKTLTYVMRDDQALARIAAAKYRDRRTFLRAIFHEGHEMACYERAAGISGPSSAVHC